MTKHLHSDIKSDMITVNNTSNFPDYNVYCTYKKDNWKYINYSPSKATLILFL